MLDMDTGNNTVPGFLLKLWTLVEDPSSDHLISWSENGSSFIIHDQAQFAKDLLPLYFKHSNTASFIRQLNMYGFRKVFSLEQGRLKSEATSLEFQHPYFLMGNENLLEMIKRKAPVPKDDITRCRSEVLSQVVTDLNLIKQENEELKANLVKRNHENDVVWRELANLKQKYQNHQQMLNKLLHFLVNLVPGNRGMNRSVKRKLPLMIENSLPEKVSRSNLDSIADNLVLTDGSTDDGPVIRDITDFVDPNSPSNRLANSLELNENSRTNISSAPSHLSMDSQLGIQPSGFDPSDILSGISANLGMENSECGRDVNDHSYSQTSKLGSNPSDISISSSKKKSMVNDSEIRNKSLIIQPVTDNLNSGSRKNAVRSSSFPNVKGNISTSSKDILSPPSADLNIHSDLGIQSSVFDPVGSNAETNDILNGITENLGIKDFDNSQYGNNHAYAQSDLTKFASSTSKDKGDMSVAIPDAPSLHIPEDNGLKGLDWLKNQLMTSGGYSIDPGYLLDLLSHSDARKSNIKPIDEKINSNEVQGNELVSRLSPSPDLSLFDVESTISSSNDLDFDLDAILGISDQINNANTLNTPEVTDKILNFDQPKDVSKNEKVSKKGKTYSKKKVK